MKKNNRGFTMIEIIGVVVIMGVILLLIIPGISKLMAQFRNDYYDKLENSINESGKDFFNDNKMYLPDGILESTYVNASELINKKYADSLLDYRGNSCSLEDKKSYVVVIYRGDGKYEYQSCVDCSDEGYTSNKNGTYCDPAWLTNNIGHDYGGTDDIYFYYGTSRDKIREELIKRLNIVRYDLEGNVLDRVVIGETKEEGILPTNIDIVDSKPVLDSDNKKEYLMIYGSQLDDDKIDNSSTENDNKLYAVIYKHKAPKVTMTTGGKTYTSGSWTNKSVQIKLEKNDNFFEKARVELLKYQMSVNGGGWQDVDCGGNDTCTIILNYAHIENTYKFRLINNEGNISDESIEYIVKIDQINPSLNVYASPDTVKVKKTIYIETGEEVTEVVQRASISYSAYDNESGIAHTYYSDGNCSGSLYSLYCSGPTSVVVTTYDVAGNSNSESVWINYEEDVITVEPEPDPVPEPDEPTPEPSEPIPEEKKTYTIYYNGNGDACNSNCPSSTVCTVDEPCTLAINNYQMANYHSTYGWNTSSSGSGTSYTGGQTVTNLAGAGESITLYSYYKCDYSARTASYQSSVAFDIKVWPWNTANWNEEGTKVLSHKSSYGCSTYRGTPGQGATCFDDTHISAGIWNAYGVTCKHCGNNSTSIWCPIHDSGSTWRNVCDANSNTFTGCKGRKS